MSTIALIILSNLGTLAVAVTVNLVTFGIRWGEMRRDIASLKESLAEIKGMFVLRLKDHGGH